MGKIRGFTLIELMTVTGIMALLSLTIVSIFLATLRGGNKSQLIQKVHQDGDYALKTMAATVRNGISVNCDNDLRVKLASGAEVVFSVVDDNGVNRIASDSSNFLTGTVANASGFDANCYQGYLGNQVATVNFSLTAGEQTGAQVQEKLTRNFATSISTRYQQ